MRKLWIAILGIALAMPVLSSAKEYAADKTALAEYPAGIYAMLPISQPIPEEVTHNPGIVGTYLQFEWKAIEPRDGEYDFSALDARIAEASAANLVVVLSIRDDLLQAPSYLIEQYHLKTVTLINTNPYRGFCEQKAVPVFWDPVFHRKRLALIRALGGRYAGNKHIVAVTAAFNNYGTDDWSMPHDQEKAIQKKCHMQGNDVQAWRQAGYTPAAMIGIGKDIIAVTAEAFPHQALKLPIGNVGSELEGKKVLDSILDYGTRYYTERFFPQVSRLDNSVPPANQINSDKKDVLYRELRQFEGHSGLQMYGAASLGKHDHCRQNGKEEPCPPREVARRSIDIALTYKPRFLEFWPQDATNEKLADLFRQATLAIGGQLRSVR